jgi:DNA-binding NarL/FixJ family response regulator
MALRLVIADGHPIVRRGLLNPLGSESDFNVVATRSSGDSTAAATTGLARHGHAGP